MSSCTKIALREIPQGTPQKWIDGGWLYFDTGEGYNFERSKSIEELKDGEIQLRSPVGGDIDPTDKNLFIANCFLNPTIDGQKYEDIPVFVIEGEKIEGDVCVRINKCNSEGIGFIMVFDKSHWVRQLSDLSLRDIFEDDEDFTWIAPNNDANGNNYDSNYIYDGTQSYWNPLVDYGDLGICGIGVGSINSSQFNPCQNIAKSQFRPWFFTQFLIEKLFCKIGHTFDSPLKDKSKWNADVDYIIDPDFGTDNDSLNDLHGRAVLTTAQSFLILGTHRTHQYIEFDSVTSDFGGNFNNRGYRANGCVDIEIEINLNMNDAGFGGVDVQVLQKPTDPNTLPFIILDEINVTQNALHADSGTEPKLIFNLKEVSTYSCFDICVGIKAGVHSGSSSSFTVNAGSTMRITGRRKYFEDGNNYKYKEIINPNLKAIEFFKGNQHIWNLLLTPSNGEYEVFAAPPYTTFDNDGDKCEGYFTEEIDDWTSKVISKTKLQEIKEANGARYCEISFKSESDIYTKSLDLESGLYSRKIDRGTKYPNDRVKKNENPFYEATANVELSYRSEYSPYQTYGYLYGLNFSSIFQSSNTNPLCVPKICGIDGDLNKPKSSWDICPRKIRAFGGVIHGDSNDQGSIPPPCIRIGEMSGSDQSTLQIPTAYQLPCTGFYNGDSDPTNPLDCGIVFHQLLDQDGNEIRTHYTDYYAQYLEEELKGVSLNFLVKLTASDFDCEDFRKCAMFVMNGLPVVARKSEIINFIRCVDDLTPMNFTPLSQSVGQSCVTGGIILSDPCNSEWSATCDKNGDCWTIGVQGSSSHPVQFISWETKEENGTWNFYQLVPDTSTTFDICESDFQGNCLMTRGTVVYGLDNPPCPPQYLPAKKLCKCVDASPYIRCFVSQQIDNSYCLNAVIETNGEPFTTILFNVDMQDGNGFVAYNGDPICNTSASIVFQATINFDQDDCPPIVLDEETCSLLSGPVES